MFKLMQNTILASIIVLLIQSLDAQLTISTASDTAQYPESEAIADKVVFDFTVTAIPPSTCDFTYDADSTDKFIATGSGGTNGDGQGTVTLVKDLDYEENNFYMVTLTATQPCDPFMTATTTLTIILEDTNDNAPYYETSLIVKSKEENDANLFVTNLKAKDLDISNEFNTNSVLFSIQDDYNGLFQLKNNGIIIDGWATADLYLTEPLDYEKSQCHQVHVIAKDFKGEGDSVLSSTAVVSIAVIDVDDQAPMFTLYTPSVEIQENVAVGSIVTTVKAVDGDHGMNQDISYSLQDEWYQINPDSGEITVKNSPDREGAGYEAGGTVLIIKATEVGNEASTATVTVTVRLTDVNDNKPTFSQEAYTGSVIESATIGYPVTLDNLIQVTDNDEEANAGFTVSIKETDVPFQLSASEGVGSYLFALVVNDDIDYDTQKSYTLTVEATDKKNGTLKNSATVTISVLDDNAVTMILDESTSECLAVKENSPIGTPVCTFKVKYSNDNNNSTRIQYTKIFGSLADSLKLDRNTGIVTIADPAIFDYELYKTFDVMVEARDNLGLAKPVTFALSGAITDVNDNSPSFSPSSDKGMIFNGETEFASPFIVQAMDVDSGVNGIVNYRLAANGNEKYFKIETYTESEKTAGKISPVNTIDMASIDACKGQGDVCNLELEVEAYDSGSPIKTSFLIVTAKIMNCYCFKTSSATTQNIAIELFYIVAIYVLRTLM